MLLLIGLDGATFDLIGPWIQTDQLPQIAKLIRDGVNGRLESTIPPMTAPAWASFMTGKNPGKHGVFDFFSGHPSNPEMVSSQSIKSPVFWDYLGKEGLRTGVLNLPLTYPPREINGYLVPGLMSPEPLGKCHPEDLISRYRDELGDYRLYPRELFEPGSRDDYLEDLNEITSRQTEYALRLFRDNPVDLGVLHLLAPDLGQHKLWQYSDPGHPWSEHDGLREGGNLLLDLFVHLDEAIGRLISAIPENSTVILMSDHGFGPQVHSINLNLHLVRAGLLKLNGSPVSLLHRWDIRWGRKPTLTSVFSKILGRDLSAGFHNVDWPATRAYAFGHMGQVYLTAKAPAKKDLDLVIETLLALRDPENDKPLVSEILRRDEIFHGPYAEEGPDLFVVFDNYRTTAYPMFASGNTLLFENRKGDSANHRPDGILIASGPQIRTGEQIANAQITDLAPTILHFFGIPIPEDMDGKVLVDLFSPDFQSTNRVPAGDAIKGADVEEPLSLENRRRIERRLRKLGYLGGQ